MKLFMRDKMEQEFGCTGNCDQGRKCTCERRPWVAREAAQMIALCLISWAILIGIVQLIARFFA